MTLRQKLEQLGVAEQPCSVLGEEFSAKLRLIEKQHGPQTLGSLAELLALLPQIRGVGRPTCTKIAHSFRNNCRLVGMSGEEFSRDYNDPAPETGTTGSCRAAVQCSWRGALSEAQTH